MKVIQTDSTNPDFISLVAELDQDLAIRDGEDNAFYAQFNKIDAIKNAMVLYAEEEAVACGAFKKFDDTRVEIKRMYVKPAHRGNKYGAKLLLALEQWAAELGYKYTVLETGKKQPEAIRLYTNYGYKITANYGQYVDIENSVCFEKSLNMLAENH